MNRSSRIAIIFFLAPIIAALLYTWYYRQSRISLMERLVDSGVIAIFNGGIITRDDLRDYFQYPPIQENSIIRSLELNPDEVKDIGLHEKDRELFQEQAGQLLLNQVIKHLALIKYLVPKCDAESQKSLEGEIKNYRETLMLADMEIDLARISPVVTQEELLSYYIEHPVEFHRTGKRYARHIMLYKNNEPTNEDNPFSVTPQQIWTRLQSGEDFHALIIETRSDNSTNEGMLGWLPRGTLHHSFEKALWALEIGEVTGPIYVDSTVHFIQLLDEQPDGLISFEECSSRIRSIIKDKKRVQHRYKLLGFDPDTFSEGSELTDEYRQRLLEAAYARGWDKNMDIVRKTNAFNRYAIANYMFKETMQQHRTNQYSTQNDDSSWILENKTALRLLEDMDFRLLIKLDLPNEEVLN